MATYGAMIAFFARAVSKHRASSAPTTSRNFAICTHFDTSLSHRVPHGLRLAARPREAPITDWNAPHKVRETGFRSYTPPLKLRLRLRKSFLQWKLTFGHSKSSCGRSNPDANEVTNPYSQFILRI